MIAQIGVQGFLSLLPNNSNYHVPGILAVGGRVELVEQVGGTEVMDDVVDEIIEAVLAKGGEVVFVDDETLSVYHRIALILC